MKLGMVFDARLCLVTVLMLTGCGSSAPVNYYSLETLETGYTRDSETATLIGVGPLRTPDYLTRSRIVTRGTNGEVVIDDFNRWAEPIEEAVYRIVSTNLDTLLEDVIVIAFPYAYIAELDYQLLGRIDQFGADENGRVILQVQWAVTKPNGDILVAPKRATYEVSVTAGRNYSAIARGMSEALQQFSRDVGGEIEAALPQQR